MRVILLQELKGTGIEGDIVEVASGYANNYLLPNNLAVLATKGNLKQLELRRHNIVKREEERMAAANELKAKMDGLSVQVEARVGEEGQLFGSVTTQMIADALLEQHGIEVDKKLIDLKAAIKTAGEHEAVVSLHRDVKSDIHLIVGDPEAIAAATAAAEAAAAEEAAALEAAAAAEAAAAEAAAAEAAAEAEEGEEAAEDEGEAVEAEGEAAEEAADAEDEPADDAE
ncbi:MAG: 50S ribosomal protein L9 [Eggerthellaceae bacterium]|nr:50S ribosomal protein L9 [Eggerthellaceae bacterium]